MCHRRCRGSLVNGSEAVPSGWRAGLHGDGRRRKVAALWQRRLELEINERWLDKRIGDAAGSNPVWLGLHCGRLTPL